MPRLARGGKWVFGWCIVDLSGGIQIPPEAYAEYGFQQGATVIITRGSRRSGGFGMGRLEKLASPPLQSCFVGQSTIGTDRQVTLAPETGLKPGDRLLVVRGSGLALGFLQRGPIYDEALRHPEIQMFCTSDPCS
jgi:hypothetical protein